MLTIKRFCVLISGKTEEKSSLTDWFLTLVQSSTKLLVELISKPRPGGSPLHPKLSRLSPDHCEVKASVGPVSRNKSKGLERFLPRAKSLYKFGDLS